MIKILVYLAWATLVGVILQGCAAKPAPLEPAIRTVTVKEAVPVPCKALQALGDEPAYADTDEAIAKAAALPDVGERAAVLAKLYAKGRLQRMQRLAEYSVARASCIF